MRLDKYLVEESYFESRNRALEAIKSGKVRVDGKVAKPSVKVGPSSLVDVEEAKFYVSRAARKLEQFLESYPLDLRGKRALDVGSSTGGFAQILLERGVVSLDCVEVGRDQLHRTIREDGRVGVYEETDIRRFVSEKCYEIVTCDVSFISVLQIIEAIEGLACAKCDIIILYKPQFEVGREVRRDSRGVVMDQDAIERKREQFEAASAQLDWSLKYQVPSGIAGKEGNVEYVYHFIKNGA